jgi:hypothetical protein
MSRAVLIVGAVLVFATGGPLYTAGSRQTPGAADTSAATQQALIKRYCVSCHNEKLKTGGLALDQFDLARAADHPEVWEKVVQKLRGGVMPPAGLPRPDKDTYEGLTTWIEHKLDSAALATPNPGRRPSFHRLNRTEYRNAIRDLLGIDIDVSSLLPPDNSSYGFDNIGDILGLSPTLLDGYLEAARRITQEAMGDPAVSRETYTYRVPGDLTQDYRLEGLPFGTRGGMLVNHTFPVDGEYVLKVELLRNFIGTVMGVAEQHQLEITLDGQRVRLFPVGGRGRGNRQAAEGDGEGGQGARNKGRPEDADLEVRIGVKGGPRAIGVAFLKRPSAQVEDIRQPYIRSNAVLADIGGGQPHVSSVAVTGPFNATAGDTPNRQRILACRPERPAQEAACAKQILSRLARRAYRRPVSDADLKPLLEFYETGRAAGSFDSGIQKALQRLLVSPEFLVRIERDPANVAPNANYRVSDLELASRLSFFLWSSLPDEELLDVAERGRLKDPAVLEQQVRRMLADERSEALTSNFAGQWLLLRNVPAAKPDPQLFPDFDDNLRDAMRRETEMLFDSVLRENRSAIELLTARYTFVNERLARHYGMPNIYGSHFRRVELGADDPRGGLLGQASVLTVTAYPNRTSPVIRGKWILENVIGAPPPPPPPNVPDLEETTKGGKVLSMRERMVQHRANAVCASCHSRMDPLGLALEHFDAIGRWRDRSESNEPIDASGTMPDGTKFDGPEELKNALVAHPERFVNTLTERLLTYALGRGVEYYDAPTIRAIVRESAASNYRLSAIVMGIIKSTPFQMRRSAERPATPGV